MTSQARWLTPAVLAIVAATFFSDFGHEMATAVLPMYLAGLSLGPLALGAIEGVADFVSSLSKLGGGYLGHVTRHKRVWASLGYVVTAVATSAIALAEGLAAILTLRCLAWGGRGFRGPLRDALLAEAVPATHFGRAYGLERAGDMLGAVAGPLAAILFLWLGLSLGSIILWALIPGLAAAAFMFFFTHEKEEGLSAAPPPPARSALPARYWWFVGGVFLFGLGDFSRTFLIYLAAKAAGSGEGMKVGALTLAVALYAGHNLISAAAAYPFGFYGDRRSLPGVLVVGYALGVATNLLLAVGHAVLGMLACAVVMSGVYIAIEETLEKAAVAEQLPREARSLGFGVLAAANAVGDMLSSLYVGYLLQIGQPAWAFGIAAAFGAAGVAWLITLLTRRASTAATASKA
jgi:MFS family permease